MRDLFLDLETYSSASLPGCGVYKYAESPDFEILLPGCSIDGSPVRTIDLACGEKIPEEVLDALTDDQVTKWAHNASFERICLSRYLGLPTRQYLSPRSWAMRMRRRRWTSMRMQPVS